MGFDSDTGWAALALLVSLAVGGCKPGVGSSCDRGDARCLDEHRELACQNGAFIETPCRGPQGCALGASGVACDISANKPGDPCSTDDEGTALCPDHTHLLACRAGQYVALACRGENGCSGEGHVTCDTSRAVEGDACSAERSKACAADGKGLLACQNGRMGPWLACRGAAGCRVEAAKLACDTSIARAGDRCEPEMEGHAFSCNEQGSAILTCKDGKFTLDQRCKPPEVCTVEGSTTRCAKPVKS